MRPGVRYVRQSPYFLKMRGSLCGEKIIPSAKNERTEEEADGAGSRNPLEPGAF